MHTREKEASFSWLPPIGAAGGYLYLVHVLQPVTTAAACPVGQVDGWRCASYQVIVSKPFFLLAGALAGTWLAYALMRLYTAPGRSFPWREGAVVAPPLLAITGWILALHRGAAWNWDGVHPLGWWEVLLFLGAAVVVRLAIGIASVANVRGGLALAFGVPIIFAGLGYASITLFQLPPVPYPALYLGPVQPPPVYHPLIGESGSWVVLGLLAGVWLAYAVAVGLGGSPRRSQRWLECAIALPAMTAAIWWALAVGPDQAGGGYVGRFVLAVCLTALLRLLLGVRTVKKAVSGMAARFGMAGNTAAG